MDAKELLPYANEANVQIYDEQAKKETCNVYCRDYTFNSVLGDIEGLKMLILPCGTGRNVRDALKRNVKMVLAVDIAEKNIEFSKSEDAESGIDSTKVTYKLHDAKYPVKFESGTCDVALIMHLLCFAKTRDELENMCLCTAMNVKRGGSAIFYSCAAWDPINKDEFERLSGVENVQYDDHVMPNTCSYDWKGLPMTMWLWRIEDMIGAIMKAGFQDVKVHKLKCSPEYKGSLSLHKFSEVTNYLFITAVRS